MSPRDFRRWFCILFFVTVALFGGFEWGVHNTQAREGVNNNVPSSQR